MPLITQSPMSASRLSSASSITEHQSDSASRVKNIRTISHTPNSFVTRDGVKEQKVNLGSRSDTQINTHKFKNVLIKSKGNGSKKAVIFAHGGFTPKRGLFREGSGIITVPKSMTILFNSKEGSPSVGMRGIEMLEEGKVLQPIDMVKGGEEMKNYSLSFNRKFETCEPTDDYDIICISKNGKAHMSDVLEAMQKFGQNYETIHSFACRIDKATWQGVRSITRVENP
ncbi:putative adhesin [Vibrio aquimaris]|nr:hypothetical protein [Vibrio aquimaris]